MSVVRLSVQVRDLVPESQAYMDLLAFERKLDSTIMRKRLDIQEALKRPMKVRTTMSMYIIEVTMVNGDHGGFLYEIHHDFYFKHINT